MKHIKGAAVSNILPLDVLNKHVRLKLAFNETCLQCQVQKSHLMRLVYNVKPNVTLNET